MPLRAMTDDRAARDLEDARLIEAGDYARLLAAYRPLIRRRVGMHLRGEDAEDVTSQVVVHLYAELTRGKRYGAPFRAVALNRARWMVSELISGKPLGPYEENPDRGEAVEARDPDDWRYVRTLLQQVAPRDREVFQLAVYGGLAPDEIASELGMKRNAVDQAMYRARRTLRKLIDG